MKRPADYQCAHRTGWHTALLSVAVVLGLTGCVAQSTYDKQVAATADLQQALAQAQTESAELATQVATLQTSSRELGAMVEELRAAIQREEDAVAAYRQKSQDKITVLQTQIASLINQGRTLGRDVADAKQQNTSLRASAAQHKRELDELREASARPATVPAVPFGQGSTLAPGQSQAAPPIQPIPSQQTAQTAPVTPASPAAGTPSRTEQSPADDSWTGWLLSWLSSLWSWIFE